MENNLTCQGKVVTTFLAIIELGVKDVVKNSNYLFLERQRETESERERRRETMRDRDIQI